MKELILENPPRRRRRRAAHHRRHSVMSNPPAKKRGRGRPAKKRGTRAKSVVRRSIRRRGRSKKMTSFGHIFGRENLTIAGGAVAASLASNMVVARFGIHLPGVGSPIGRTLYNLVIPVAAAYFVRRVSPDVARGLVIGGTANALGQVLTFTRVLPSVTGAAQPSALPAAPAAPMPPAAPAAPAATGEYLGEYLGAYPNALSGAFGSAW